MERFIKVSVSLIQIVVTSIILLSLAYILAIICRALGNLLL